MAVTRIVHIVNRTLEPLEVMDDGIVWTMRPGYKAVPVFRDGKPSMTEGGQPEIEVVGSGPNGDVLMEPVPFFAAERAIRQNPVMGTEDPYNPQAFESLVGVPAWGHDYSFRPQSDAIERLDRSMLPAAEQNVTIIPGRGRRTKVKIRDPKTGQFKMVDPSARTVLGAGQSLNPAGIVTRIDG